MSSPAYKTIVRDGLWANNPGLVQLLGLCPLMAVSNTVINALGLALATLFVLIASNLTISLIRNLVSPEVRLPVFVMVIAGFVTTVELLTQAFMYELYLALGIFLPLITTNCAIIGRAEAFAAKTDPVRAATDGLMMGLGFGAVLVVLGAIREALGQGTLLAQADFLFGPAASNWTIQLADNYDGFLLAVLPPGAFIGLGLLVALKNWIDRAFASRQPLATDAQATASA